MALLPKFLRRMKRDSYRTRQVKRWEEAGCPIPPIHVVKQCVVQEYGARFGCSILVETGTYKGQMIEAQKLDFKRIYSIELSRKLFEEAQQKFKKNCNIEILWGDSGDVLPRVVDRLEGKAVFWLDGHYSGSGTARGKTDCPIFQELEPILHDRDREHIVLIDDARHFDGRSDYPDIDALISFIKTRRPTYDVIVKNDIIRCTPAA